MPRTWFHLNLMRFSWILCSMSAEMTRLILHWKLLDSKLVYDFRHSLYSFLKWMGRNRHTDALKNVIPKMGAYQRIIVTWNYIYNCKCQLIKWHYAFEWKIKTAEVLWNLNSKFPDIKFKIHSITSTDFNSQRMDEVFDIPMNTDVIQL